MKPLPELDWDDLRYYLRAARAKTLAGAAREMGVDHTTIGRRLTALERAVGASLVIRGADGLRLTPIGERALPLIEDVERAVTAVRELVASRRSHVRLSVPSGFVKLVAADLERLGEERPDLSIELISGVRAVDLEAGQADLAVRSGAITDKQLIVRAIGDAGFSLYASDAYLARHPQSFDSKDLRGHAVIGYASSVAALPPASWIEAHAAGATIVLRNREIADMVDAAMSGIGIALLPCMLGDLEPSLRRLTPEVIAKSRFSLVYPREARRSEALRTVVRWLLRSLERHAVLIRGEPSRASSTLTPPERNSR